MTIEEQALQLSKPEKLRLMESLWTDLSQDESSIDSPGWHQEELAQTEKRRANGQEELLEWEDAKKQLRAE